MAKPPRRNAKVPRAAERKTPPIAAVPVVFRHDRAIAIAVLVAALIAFLALALGNVLTTSPTMDEPTHLAAGYSYLATGDYRLNTEHPPLLKKLAALPLRAISVWPPSFDHGTADTTEAFKMFRLTWDDAEDTVASEWDFAHFFFWARRDPFVRSHTTDALPKSAFVNDSDAMFTRARIAMLITGVLAIVLVFLWSAELWGYAGAILSTLLIAFDPNFIANSGLITTDVGVTALMCGAVWFFWRCCRRFNAPNVIGFAVFFALAQIAKFSALMLVPMIGILVLHRLFSRDEWNVDAGDMRAKVRALAIVLGVGAVVTVTVIWSAYGFRREASPGHPRPFAIVLDDWYTVKSLLPQYPDGPPDDLVIAGRSTSRVGFLGRTIARANDLRLLPEAYLFGFAQLNRDAIIRYCFLRGEASETGFRSYFLWTILYKTTIPALLCIVAGLVLARPRHPVLPFLLWPVAIYLGFAIASDINIGHRHILPIYPFLYVLCGALVLPWSRLSTPAKAIWSAAAAILIPLASVVVLLPAPAWMWGRHLSYMNAFAGGPRNGFEKLVDSNFDWGQDLPRLAAWLRERKIAEPVNLVYIGPGDPRYYGVPFVNQAFGLDFEPMVAPDELRKGGILAISASKVEGVMGDPNTPFFWRDYLARSDARRIGSAGYSILIYEFPKR